MPVVLIGVNSHALAGSKSANENARRKTSCSEVVESTQMRQKSAGWIAEGDKFSLSRSATLLCIGITNLPVLFLLTNFLVPDSKRRR
jgi:hypothetical protein